MYQFNFAALSGRYQFKVDDNFIQKTVELTGAVTYYVPAGVHQLAITPDSSQGAAWSLSIAATGTVSDSLPYRQTGGNLGSISPNFSNEWLPINLAAAAETNVSLTLAGNTANYLDVYFYDAASTTPVYTVTHIYGQETQWWIRTLPVGVSRIKLVATNQVTGTLAYTLTIAAKPGAPIDWAGAATATGNNSQVQFQISSAGLYNLTYGVASGQYQFVIDDTIQKTAVQSGSVPFYLSAGAHRLTIKQAASRTLNSVDVWPGRSRHRQRQLALSPLWLEPGRRGQCVHLGVAAFESDRGG